MVHLLRKRGIAWTSRSTKKKIAANNSVLMLNHDNKDDDSSSSSSQRRKISSLAKKGKFDLLLHALNEMPRDRFLQSSTISSNDAQHGRAEPSSSLSSILHVVLAHRPPLHIVELILNRMKDDCCDDEDTTENCFPVPEEIKDASGQTPLHLAVAAGCDITIIDRLLSGVSLLVPALTKDLLDRYPLHWACLCCRPHYSSLKKSRSSSSSYCRAAERENRRETVFLLLNTYPVAVVIADVYGKTPLDYAMENKQLLDVRIVDALQTVAKHHQKYKALGRQLGAVSSANRAAAPPPPRAEAKQQPKSTLLKRKKLLLRGKLRSPALFAPHNTSEMTTERDSTDNEDPAGNRTSSSNDDEGEDKVCLPVGLLLTRNSSTLSERRNTLRVDNNMADDLSTLGWDVLSATAPSSPTKKRSSASTSAGRSSGPMVRVKTLAVSPPPAPSASVHHHQHVAAVAALATSGGVIITSHVRCRCKSLLRGRLKHDKPNSSKEGGGGGRRRRRVSIKTTTTRSPPKEDDSLTPPTPSSVEEPPPAAPGAEEEQTPLRAEELLEDQVEQEVVLQHKRTTAIHAYRRFVRV